MVSLSRHWFSKGVPYEIIDLPFLETKLLDYPDLECYYCKKVMEFNPTNRKNLVTIERLNNSIGHIKSNCEFCCLNCNAKKISNKINN